VLRQALADQAWHVDAGARLHACSDRLAALLVRHGLAPTAGCAFFQWWRDARADQMHEALAKQGILTRCFDSPGSLRFGLPGDEAAFARLDAALGSLALQGGSP
jgi:histidinol-phosphate/aromatic aminotransferase/cobyric acid decarboxylase-like protein